jgi:hypothetical protein
MWRNVFLASLGIACVLGGILHIRRPDRLANTWGFRHLTIAGLILSRGSLLMWVRFLGIVLIVTGTCMVVYVAERLRNGG